MTVPPKERGQLIILLAGWLFFGGGASSALVVYDRSASDMKKVIKQVIVDSERRETILSDLSQWKSRQKKQDKEARADRKDLFKLLRRRDTQRSDVEPSLAKLDQTFLEMDQSFLDLRFRMKERVTSAEWAEIVARPDR